MRAILGEAIMHSYSASPLSLDNSNLCYLFFFLLLLCSCAVEPDDLLEEANELFSAGQYDQARSMYERIIAWEEEEPLPTENQVFQAKFQLVMCAVSLQERNSFDVLVWFCNTYSGRLTFSHLDTITRIYADQEAWFHFKLFNELALECLPENTPWENAKNEHLKKMQNELIRIDDRILEAIRTKRLH